MKNRSNEWTIIGMGMGGKGLAAELGLAGYRLRVHDINEDEIRDIGLNGGVKVKGRDRDFAPVDSATTDLATRFQVRRVRGRRDCHAFTPPPAGV
jgi:3-hydroxyisobutyrate dehydrogenase-like beta-hydroxyacid dehydrogenase